MQAHCPFDAAYPTRNPGAAGSRFAPGDFTICDRDDDSGFLRRSDLGVVLAVLEAAAGAEGEAGAVHDVPAAVEIKPGIAEGEGLLDFGAGQFDRVALDLRVTEAVDNALLWLAGLLVDFAEESGRSAQSDMQESMRL